jgi:hypothetical protein
LCIDLQHFWEMLEGGEGRTEGALERLGLKAFAKEKAVVLSMGQVGCTILFCSKLCSKFCYYIFLRKWLEGEEDKSSKCSM